jgi:hypothetical protein
MSTTLEKVKVTCPFCKKVYEVNTILAACVLRVGCGCNDKNRKIAKLYEVKQ